MRMFLVIGFNNDNNKRFQETIEAKNHMDAEDLTILEYKDQDLYITAVVDREHPEKCCDEHEQVRNLGCISPKRRAFLEKEYRLSTTAEDAA